MRADLVQSLILSLQTFPSYKTRRTLDLAMDESTYSSVLPRSEIRVSHLHTQSGLASHVYVSPVNTVRCLGLELWWKELTLAVLIFGASIAVLFLFSLILIKGSRVMDQRRGVVKVDGMVGESPCSPSACGHTMHTPGIPSGGSMCEK